MAHLKIKSGHIIYKSTATHEGHQIGYQIQYGTITFHDNGLYVDPGNGIRIPVLFEDIIELEFVIQGPGDEMPERKLID